MAAGREWKASGGKTAWSAAPGVGVGKDGSNRWLRPTSRPRQQPRSHAQNWRSDSTRLPANLIQDPQPEPPPPLQVDNAVSDKEHLVRDLEEEKDAAGDPPLHASEHAPETYRHLLLNPTLIDHKRGPVQDEAAIRLLQGMIRARQVRHETFRVLSEAEENGLKGQLKRAAQKELRGEAQMAPQGYEKLMFGIFERKTCSFTEWKQGCDRVEAQGSDDEVFYSPHPSVVHPESNTRCLGGRSATSGPIWPKTTRTRFRSRHSSTRWP